MLKALYSVPLQASLEISALYSVLYLSFSPSSFHHRTHTILTLHHITYTNPQALSVSNVETVIVFRACSPIAVTVVEYLFMDRSWPNIRSMFSLLVVRKRILKQKRRKLYVDGRWEMGDGRWEMGDGSSNIP
jgi:hypothetical protein